MTALAGDGLAKQIIASRKLKASQHPGDYLSSLKTVKAFDSKANDPEIAIPANAGIRSVEVWSQHTLHDLLTVDEDFINL